MAGRLSNHVTGAPIKEEKGDKSGGDDEHHRSRKEENTVSKVGNKRKGINEMVNPSSPSKQKGFSNKQVVDATKIEMSSVEGPNSIASSSTLKDNDDYHELQKAKAEMSEVREENQRLRMYLDQITKDYHTLQMQLNAISQQDTRSKSIIIPHPKLEEQPEFVSLSLGRTASLDSKKRDEMKNKASTSSKLGQEHGNLSLGLDCKFDQQVSKIRSPPPRDNDVLQHPINISSPENSSFDEPRDQEASETTNWPPSKMPNTMSSVEHSEISPSTNVNARKARVSVRARCDTPTMNDGCQWRKYGQKISKGNPCPRAYYRCTVAPSCPVRKQVQRCAQDMSILITTYEGTHNHTLPIAATAMASTTSAAATMLLSGSSTSRSGLLPSTSTTIGTGSDQLHGLNLYLSDNSKPNQFYYPYPSIQSSASSCPTITLDLTSSSSSSAFSSHFGKLPNYSPPTQRYSSLNFSSLESSNTLPISWSNGQLTYGTNNASTQPSYNNTNSIIGSMNLGARQHQIPLQENGLYQSFMQKNNNIDTSHSSDTIKAITSDPSFQSALAAALTSIIGGGNHNHGGLLSENSNFGQKLKWGEQFVPSTLSNRNIINIPSSSNNSSQPSASLMLLPPSSSSLPFSRSKSASTSPDESRDREDN